MRSLLLAVMVTYSSNTVWWKKVDQHYDSGNMYFACRMIWSLYCEVGTKMFLNIVNVQWLMKYEFHWLSLI